MTKSERVNVYYYFGWGTTTILLSKFVRIYLLDPTSHFGFTNKRIRDGQRRVVSDWNRFYSSLPLVLGPELSPNVSGIKLNESRVHSFNSIDVTVRVGFHFQN